MNNSVYQEDDLGEAIPFIYFNRQSNGKKLGNLIDVDVAFAVNEDAVSFLKSLQGCISVVSIVGKYRKGKSYIMNKLVSPNGRGCFGIGHTTNACTQGLWIRNRAQKVRNRLGQDINVVYVDTEGLADTQKDRNNDVKIFTFAVLLSSMLLFNVQGVIAKDEIDLLSLVTKMTQRIRISSKDCHAEPAYV